MWDKSNEYVLSTSMTMIAILLHAIKHTHYTDISVLYAEYRQHSNNISKICMFYSRNPSIEFTKMKTVYASSFLMDIFSWSKVEAFNTCFLSTLYMLKKKFVWVVSHTIQALPQWSHHANWSLSILSLDNKASSALNCTCLFGWHIVGVDSKADNEMSPWWPLLALLCWCSN